MEKQNLSLVVSAILCASLLLGFDIQNAYAVLTINVITPTGGNLASTSDCTGIAILNGIIWHGCNGIIYAISEDTNAVIANVTASYLSVQVTFLASNTGTNLYVFDSTDNDIYQYTLSGSSLTQTNFLDPACDFGINPQYDAEGYIWINCGTTDIIKRFNPASFTIVMTSQDLTDSVGIECDNPAFVTFDSENLGFIRCTTTNNIVSFSIASPTSITLLDSETGTIGTNHMFTDNPRNILIATDGTQVERWSYTSGGILTLETTLTTDTTHCDAERALAANHLFILCYDDINPNIAIQVFLNNATDVYSVVSGFVATYNDPHKISIGLNGDSFATWIINSNANNQRYILLGGLRQDDSSTPTPPSGGEGEDRIINGVNCSLPQNHGILLCIEGAENGSIFPDGKDAGDVGNDFGCLLTVIECTDGVPNDSNPQTNGIGLALTLLAELVAVAFLTIASRGQLVNIHPVAWALVFVGIVGISFMFGFIELQWFLLVVFFSIAFVAIKIVPTFTGLGGGSSA